MGGGEGGEVCRDETSHRSATLHRNEQPRDNRVSQRAIASVETDRAPPQETCRWTTIAELAMPFADHPTIDRAAPIPACR